MIEHPDLIRPAEVDLLRGDASKAEKVLGWKPQTSFRQLIELMVDADVARYENQTAEAKSLPK